MARGARIALGTLLVAVALGVVIEVAGRSALESAVHERLVDSGVSGEVSVSLGEPWRPSLAVALVSGRLDRLDVRLRDATFGGIGISRADYELTDLEVQASLRARTVGASSLGSGSVRVVIDPAALGELIGDTVELDDGQVLVGADREPATLRIDGDEVVVGAGGRSDVELARFTARDPHHLPCRPDVRVEPRHVVLACSGSDLPGMLRAPLGPIAVDEDAPAPEVQLEPPLTIDLDEQDGADGGD